MLVVVGVVLVVDVLVVVGVVDVLQMLRLYSANNLKELTLMSS